MPLHGCCPLAAVAEILDVPSPAIAMKGLTRALGKWMTLAMLAIIPACQCRDQGSPRRPSTVEGEARTPQHVLVPVLAEAARAAIGDLDGDGASEVVLVYADRMRVVDLSGDERAGVPAPGGIQVLEIHDIDADGRFEILAGWGRTSARPDSPARVSVYRLVGTELEEEQIIVPSSDRAEVVAMVPTVTGAAPELLLAYFVSKYMVRAVRASRNDENWTVSDGPVLRMATSWAIGDVDGDGTAESVVGRVYGDARSTDGDAFVLDERGGRTPIPTTRGVRGLALADLDGDGIEEILLGDGWHASYADKGRALLTLARSKDTGFSSEILDSDPDQYAVWDILPVDLDGDGQLEIVTRGSHRVRVLYRTRAGWQVQAVAGESRDVAIGELGGAPGLEILVLGKPDAVVSWPVAD